MPAPFQVATAHVNLVIDGGNASVLFRAYFEFRDRLRFDQKLRQLLVFRQHDLHRPAGDLCNVGDQWIKAFCSQAGGSEGRTVVLIDESDFRRIHPES